MSAQISREYFYYAKCLTTGRELKHKPNAVCESASTIKVPILVALLKEVERGRISLKGTLKLKSSHHSHYGSGVLNNFYKTRPLVIHDLALMMIILSDNIATNALIELIGKDKINRYIREFGMPKTKLVMSRLTFPENYSIDDDKIGETTPQEMASLLERSLSGDLLNSTHTNLMRKFLSRTQSTFFGRRLPTEHNTKNGVEITAFGNKTGACYYDKENMQAINDCGFFKTKNGNIDIFSVFSMGAADEKMQYTADSFSRTDFADVSKTIYEELKQ